MSRGAPVRERAFDYWWTRQEWARDKRTGTVAVITEDPEQAGTWNWRVGSAKTGLIRGGTSKSQKGARAACRRVARKLPNNESIGS